MDRRLLAVAALHAVVALAHGVPHELAGVALADWQTAVVAVTTLGPFAAAALADRRPVAAGAAFAALLVGSVVFGVANHWLLGGADDVRNVVAPHRDAFAATAVALAVVGAVGVWAGYSSASR